MIGGCTSAMSTTEPAGAAPGGAGARRRRLAGARAAGILGGFLLDRAFGDPARLHPVAGFGRAAQAVEGLLLRGGASPARQRAAGALFTAVTVGGAAGVVTMGSRAARRITLRSPLGPVPLGSTAWTALVVWSCLGGSSLLEVAQRQGDLLARGDHAGSRELLPWLCGRDPDALDPPGLARAVVESVAENTSDAAVGTLFWAAVAGPTGAAVHRAANTLDAMVGHRSERYRDFGWASARLDDVLGWPAARAAGLLTAALAGVAGGRARESLRVWRRDAAAHPSPNAGVVEAATAGALGVRLGGRTPYPYGVEHRPTLGDGPAPGPADVRRSGRLMRAVQVGAALLAVGGLAVAGPAPAHAWRSRARRRAARRCSAS